MKYSILFVIIVILVSGFIAYFGDILGRKMGKKRLTIFNLRPRYTAIVVTTITGMIISALVLTTLLGIDTQFRKVFTEGDQILAKNDSLRKDNSALTDRNKLLLQRSREMELQVKQRQKELIAAQADAAKAKIARDAAEKVVAGLKSEIAARMTDLQNLKKQADIVDDALVLRTDQLRNVQQQLTSANEKLAQAKAKVVMAESQRIAAEARLETVNARLEDTRKQLEEADNTLKQQQVALEGQKKQIEDQQARLVELRTAAIQFQQQSSDLRNRDLILRQGDEIARGTISPAQSSFGIKSDLVSLLESASSKAAELGAVNGANSRTVNLIFRQVLTKDVGVYNDDESECIKMAIDAIAQRAQQALVNGQVPDQALVRVVCATNSIAGEQVPVELMLYSNSLVYRKGDEIARTKMDGRASEGRVLLSIIDFLQKDVSKAGLSKGIIPASSPSPRANLSLNPQAQFEGLMNVVDQIRSKKTRVNVGAYACADIYASESLTMTNMRFSVTKIQ